MWLWREFFVIVEEYKYYRFRGSELALSYLANKKHSTKCQEIELLNLKLGTDNGKIYRRRITKRTRD